MKTILLSRGFVANVDDADYERVIVAGPWYAVSRRKQTYAYRSVRKANKKWTLQPLHRFILGMTDTKVWVDHADCDGLNNQRANLRICTPSQNRANTTKRPGTSSQYKGVHWNRARGKWQAVIKVGGKSRGLGYFTDEAEAASAYRTAAREAFGAFARAIKGSKASPRRSVDFIVRTTTGGG